MKKPTYPIDDFYEYKTENYIVLRFLKYFFIS